eukprot:116966-Amphidinium_carterae.1
MSDNSSCNSPRKQAESIPTRVQITRNGSHFIQYMHASDTQPFAKICPNIAIAISTIPQIQYV